MVLYFITGNIGKFEEAKKDLSPIEIKQKEIDLLEIQSLDPIKIIECKLKEAAKFVEGEIFVEDVSFYLEGLNDLPGPLIKLFVQSLGRGGIYNLCKSIGNFNAKALATIGYLNKNEIQFFQGEIKGTVVEKSGDSGFGWDPIFQPIGFDKTFAQMTQEEKNSISHRGIAIKKFKSFLEK
jgi:non-canonical purine NTP pyrophosphatase (RdgB/HAM1 family)